MRKILLFLFAMILSANAGAIGVGTPFLPQDTLKLPQDTQTTYTIELQNTAENEVEFEIQLSGGGVASFSEPKNKFIVPANNLKYPVILNITPPESAGLGDIYKVEFSVVANDRQGSFPMAVGMSKKFTVEITKNENKFYFKLFKGKGDNLGIINTAHRRIPVVRQK